jgi:hypothetical protein
MIEQKENIFKGAAQDFEQAPESKEWRALEAPLP